jgi:hypothetical protein
MAKLRNQSRDTTLALSNEGSKDPPSSLLKKFASDHKLKMERDDCNDHNIIGKAGSICDYGDGKTLLATILTGKSGWWKPISTEAKDAGCTITQSGDQEGSFRFSPGSPQESSVALRGIRPIKKRRSSGSPSRFAMSSL